IPKVKGGVMPVPTCVVFGGLSLNSPAQQVIELYDAAAPPRAIKSVVSTKPERFTVRLLPLSHMERGRTRQGITKAARTSKEPLEGCDKEEGANESFIARLEVVVDTQQPGPIDGDIQIYLDEEGRPPDTIPVVGSVLPTVSIAPESLVLPRQSGSGRVHFAD